MLALTKRTEYALIALRHMMEQGAVVGRADEVLPASAREVAERYGMPVALVMNVLKKLAGSGIVVSLRGPNGGYVMAAEARHLSLAQVIEAVEGPVSLVECACEQHRGAALADGEEYPCRIMQSCPIKGPLQKLHDRLMEFLRTTTVDEICSGREEMPLMQVGMPSLAG